MKYRNINLESRGKVAPLQESDITDFEKEFSLKLPHKYRVFIRDTNGGKPDKYIAVTQNYRTKHHNAPDEVQGYGGDFPIDSFLAFASEYYDIYNYYGMFKSRIPDHMLPIACVDGGGVIILGLKGEHEGKVFAWFHEGEAEEDNANYFGNVFLIDEDFDMFVDGLLNYYQFVARYDNKSQLNEAYDSWLKYLEYYKNEKNIDSLSDHYVDGAFLDAMLSQFESSKENLAKGIKLHEELGYELSAEIDWHKWADYLNLANKEQEILPLKWRANFADRISFVEV